MSAPLILSSPAPDRTEQLQMLVGHVLGIPETLLVPERRIEPDGLDLVDIALGVERVLGIGCDVDDVARCRTFGELAALVHGRRSARTLGNGVTVDVTCGAGGLDPSASLPDRLRYVQRRIAEIGRAAPSADAWHTNWQCAELTAALATCIEQAEALRAPSRRERRAWWRRPHVQDRSR